MNRSVLFLCKGNSCRSQMAEAIVHARYSKEWRAFSAGTHPAGFVHPMAIQVLQEIGIEHHGASKSIDRFRDKDFDLVITVCDDANEACPLFTGRVGRRIHMGFEDPSFATGSREQKLAEFRRVRDLIRMGFDRFYRTELLPRLT